MKRNLESVLCLGLFLLPACSGGGSSGTAANGPGGIAPAAGEVTVSEPVGRFSSVQAAFDAASDGAIVRLGPGDFQGPFVVTSAMTVIGSGEDTVIRWDGAALGSQSSDEPAALEIRGAINVRIRDVAVRGRGDGVRVRDSVDVELLRVTASQNGGNGFEIRGSDQVSLVSCVAEDNRDRGYRVRKESRDVAITDSTATRNGDDGIRVHRASQVVVRDGTFADNRGDGIEVRDANQATVTGNSSSGNFEWGIRVRSSLPLTSTSLGQTNAVGVNGQGSIRVDN